MMSKTFASPRGNRGFAMIFALLVIVILLLVGLAMLANAQNVAGNARNTEVKTLTWDAAEAGLNSAMDKLDLAITSTTPGNGTLQNNYTFAYTITPNFAFSTPKGGTDSTGAAMTIPPHMGYVQSTGTSPDGLRTAIVEAIIQPTGITQTFPNDAMDAGGDIQGNWNHKTGITECHPGKNDATAHANGNITAAAGFDEGTSTASGTTNTLMSGPGSINTPVVTLPTASLPSFVADAKTIAQAGGTSLYIPSGGTIPPTFACPLTAPTYGCVIFYDAALHISGLQSFSYTGHVVVVINGDYSSTGNSGFTLQSGQQSVFVVNGNADMGGNSDTGALYWTKGDTTLHGNGNTFGAIVTGGNVIFAGGGSGGGFACDPNALGLTLKFPGKVIIKSYAEY